MISSIAGVLAIVVAFIPVVGQALAGVLIVILIRTPDGDRPIEDLRAGDTVWTRDLASGLDVLETVEETFVRTTTTH